MIHNPMMRNYFLSSRHDSTECEIENCVACALTISFSDVLATEKLDGHGPVDLLYRSWKHAPVSLCRKYCRHEVDPREDASRVCTAGCPRILPVPPRPLAYLKRMWSRQRPKKLQLSLSSDILRKAEKHSYMLKLQERDSRRRPNSRSQLRPPTTSQTPKTHSEIRRHR